MLNIIEKIQYVISGLVILVVVVLYAWIGPVRDAKGLIEPVTVEVVKPTRPVRAAKPGAPSKPPSISQQDKTLLDRLAKEQGQKATSVTHARATVPKRTLDFLSDERNWILELKKAASRTMKGADGKNSRLMVNEISEDSILKMTPIQNGDIIEFIDGTRLDFDNRDITKYRGLINSSYDKLINGGSFTLTLTRRGKPMQLEFRLK